MISSLAQFLGSAAVIVAAAIALTRFSDVIAHRTKLGGLLVGSILLAAATSLPELSIDISAVRLGAPDLAAGDLIGSSLFNLLILAGLDLTPYSRHQMLSRASAAHAIAATASIALTAVVAAFILAGSILPPVTFAGIGAGSFALVIAYIACVRLIYYGEKFATQKTNDSPKEPGVARQLGLRTAIIGYGVSAAVIIAVAPFLASAADDLAERSGLGGTFFGTTFVALCTSLPEAVTTLTAVKMKAFDMAIGNVFGSNCFNMVLFVPLDFFHDGSLLAAVSPTHIFTALCVIVVTATVALGHLARAEKQPFVEPNAPFVIALILGSLAGVYLLG
jgi:cation:H+ antiporter